MIVLRDDQLPEFVAELEEDFPASLNIYFLARNRLQKNRLAWPGISFVVDNFPNFSACLGRTDPSDLNLPPLTNGYSIWVHARDPAKLKKLLDQPNVVDWTQRIGVHNVQRPENLKVMTIKCQSLGGQLFCSPEGDYFVEREQFVGFPIKDVKFEYILPEGFRVGPLEEKHAEQLTREKHYGDLEKNLLFFRYLLRTGFPSAAVFNEEDQPVAYILQRPEGCLGCGYVVSEYRSQGFFKVVCYELLEELERQGDAHFFADVTVGNMASLGAMLSIGGFVYPDYEACWFEFLPKTTDTETGS